MDLSEEDLRRRRENAQRFPRENGDENSLKAELDRLKGTLEDTQRTLRETHGVGGAKVNWPVISIDEQRRRGGVPQTELVHFNKAGTFVARRMLVAGPATTDFL